MTLAEIKDNILKKANLVNVIQKYVKLKKQGKDFFGLCPFHNEKTPSFTVDPVKQIFKCFGCGSGGDVIEFIMKKESISFVDSLSFIAKTEFIPISFDEQHKPESKREYKPIEVIPRDVFTKSLKQYEENNFYLWLSEILGEERALKEMFKWYVGTAKNNGTIFWQIDQMGRCRNGQRIVYKKDGHRDKEIAPKRFWEKGHNYTPCLFGEHQLRHATKNSVIGIVESEKTAILASIYIPTFAGKDIYWMASLGSNGMTEDKITPLRGLTVVLCPDFHYASRAVWGAVKMRKKIVDGVRKMDQDGEIDEDYVPVGKKLARIGCKVMFYDPLPSINDGSDLADWLIHEVPPDEIEQANEDELIIPEIPFE